MGRAPCRDDGKGLKKGPWTPEEDKLLVDYIQANGSGNWRLLPKLAGLNRCGKSCRLRWTNYLRPDIKRGPFTDEEHKSILQLHGIVGNKWSMIAAQLPGRTDNEIKNYWNTHLKKQLRRTGTGEAPSPGLTAACPAARHMAQWENARLEAEARLSLLASSAGTTTTTTGCSSSSTVTVAFERAAGPDVFLRLWNSEVGDSFRRYVASPAEKRVAKEEAAALPPGDDSSAASNEMELLADVVDEYQMFLDFAGEELGLFHARYGGFSLFPPAEVLAEASLNTAFE